MKGLIHNNVLIQIEEKEFPVHPDSIWVDVPDGVPVGWNYDGTNFNDPDTRTDEEKFNDSLYKLRVRRSGLLAQSDWTQAKDVNLSNADEWTTYRKSLRDITNGLTTIADIETVTWPTKPE